MPFTDEEQILEMPNSKMKNLFLFIAIGLFFLSLFFDCYCTYNGCTSSLIAFLLGWLGIFSNIAAISWFANIFLFITWLMLIKNNKQSWILSLITCLLMLSFIFCDEIIVNEAGGLAKILKIKNGYWLWLSSSFASYISSMIININLQKRQH